MLPVLAGTGTVPVATHDVDRQILHLLQGNARGVNTETIGQEVGVAASTVRNRLDEMEEADVIGRVSVT